MSSTRRSGSRRTSIRLGECVRRRTATMNDQQSRPSTSLSLRQPLDVEVHHLAEVELSVHLRSIADALMKREVELEVKGERINEGETTSR